MPVRERRARWPAVLVVVLLIIPGLALGGRTTAVAFGPTSGRERLVGEQISYLHQRLDDGAAAQMQQVFPEGSFFSYALTASAAARSGDPARLRLARDYRDRLEDPAELVIFGSGLSPEHGIFATGWALAVGTEIAAVSDDPTDRQWVAERAPTVLAALTASRSGFPASYPGQYWPCDAVVAAGALASAAVQLDRPDWLAQLRDWRSRVQRAADPQLGLLPHQVDADGRALTGPRGSSQAIIQTFWPQLTRALDGRADLGSWQRFSDAFVTRTAGLVGVREYPRRQSGAGDVDSGPLVLGVSLSASVVGLAAARSVGDLRLADDLDREAELVGLGVSWSGERRYAFGVLPIGDAFLAWARTRPFTPDQPDPTGVAPRPHWAALTAVAFAPALIGVMIILLLSRRPRSSRPADPQPEQQHRKT